jgi:hypothetical protein
MVPLLELCGVLEREKATKSRLRPEKLAALKSLTALWTKEFPVESDGDTVAKAAKAVLGVLVHVLLAATALSDGAESEASMVCLGRVLGSCGAGALADALPAASAARVLSALSMALPPPPGACEPGERPRSEEEIMAALGCLRQLVRSGSSSVVDRQSLPAVQWLAVPGSKAYSSETAAAVEASSPCVQRWREAFGAALAESDEGRGALAQIVHAALTAARGGPSAVAGLPGSTGVGERVAAWPAARLPRAVGTCALALLDALLDLLARYPTLWRQFLPGLASQLFQLLARGAAAAGPEALRGGPPPSWAVLGSFQVGAAAVGGRSSGGRDGSGGGFATAADLARRRAAAPAATAAAAVAVLARAVAVTCADAANAAALGAAEATEWRGFAATLSQAATLQGSPGQAAGAGSVGDAAAWRAGAVGRLETVLAGALVAARAHESWRVR